MCDRCMLVRSSHVQLMLKARVLLDFASCHKFIRCTLISCIYCTRVRGARLQVIGCWAIEDLGSGRYG